VTDQGEPGPAGGGPGGGGTPTEDELRAAYEQQVKQIHVEQIVLENVITVLNLGMRRTGLSPGTEDERDPAQVRVAIESIRSQLPLLEQVVPEHVRQIRDALSQLQMAFIKIGGKGAAAEGSEQPDVDRPGGPASAAPEGPPSPGEPGEPAPKPGEPGPAQRSGRLWVPGQ
jgi:hypothetical protein